MTHYRITAYGSHADRDAGRVAYRACYAARGDAMTDYDAIPLPIVDVTACACDGPIGVRCTAHGSGHRFVGADPYNGRCACGIRQDERGQLALTL